MKRTSEILSNLYIKIINEEAKKIPCMKYVSDGREQHSVHGSEWER